jgi:hypothetical protein
LEWVTDVASPGVTRYRGCRPARSLTYAKAMNFDLWSEFMAIKRQWAWRGMCRAAAIAAKSTVIQDDRCSLLGFGGDGLLA